MLGDRLLPLAELREFIHFFIYGFFEALLVFYAAIDVSLLSLGPLDSRIIFYKKNREVFFEFGRW